MKNADLLRRSSLALIVFIVALAPVGLIRIGGEGDHGLRIICQIIIGIIGIYCFRRVLKSTKESSFRPVDFLAHAAFIVVSFASAALVMGLSCFGLHYTCGIMYLFGPGEIVVLITYIFLRTLYVFYKKESLTTSNLLMGLATVVAIIAFALMTVAEFTYLL